MKCKRKCMGKRVQRGMCGIALLLIFPYLFGGCGFARQSESLQVIGSDGQPVVIDEKGAKKTETDAVLTQSNQDGTTQRMPQSNQDGATQSMPQSNQDGAAQEMVQSGGSSSDTSASAVCVVYVCGAVKRSGVYHLPSGSRIVDAIEAAGGCTKGADSESLNQAEFVTDGQRLYIPKKGEQSQNVSGETGSQISSQNDLNSSQNGETGINAGKVNLNTATKEQLMTLPGVGESKALAILAYRQEHGAFQSVDEIKNISGIKDGVYNKIKDSIVVG